MLAMFVVFTTTVEFFISAVYMGGVPEAEHDSVLPDKTLIVDVGNIGFGGTVE